MAVGTNAKQDAKSQRIKALEELVMVLRKQIEQLRATARVKDSTIAAKQALIESQRLQISALRLQVAEPFSAAQQNPELPSIGAASTAQNTVATYRNDGESG